MTIHELLGLDVDPDRFPVTNELQNSIREILQKTPEGSGDSPLVEALAFAVLGLETSLLYLRSDLMNARTDGIHTRNYVSGLHTYIVDLETRLVNARVRGMGAGASKFPIQLPPPFADV